MASVRTVVSLIDLNTNPQLSDLDSY
jgi:hypothetical protein